MLHRSHRLIPRLRMLIKKRNIDQRAPHFYQCEAFHERRDPFAQMEAFMRDVERKFRREFDRSSSYLPIPRFGRYFAADSPGVSNVSTNEKFKLEFNFPRANPDNIKVTLKDRSLTIEAKIEESGENSKLHQSYSYEYTIPEGVDTDALQSLFSPEGILTIEAPRSGEAPRPIDIKRE